MKEYKYTKSVRRKGQDIKVSAAVHRAETIFLDPLSLYYRKQLKSLTKAGYEVIEPFNYVYYKEMKTGKKSDQEVYKNYFGSVKLVYKGD